MDMKTSNLEFSSYLACIGCKLVDIEISAKGIAYWIYQAEEGTDHWMDFLRDAPVSAVKYATCLRACKAQAFEGRSKPQVVRRRS